MIIDPMKLTEKDRKEMERFIQENVANIKFSLMLIDGRAELGSHQLGGFLITWILDKGWYSTKVNSHGDITDERYRGSWKNALIESLEWRIDSLEGLDKVRAVALKAVLEREVKGE